MEENISRHKLTFRNAKRGQDGFHQTQQKEGAGAHVSQEEHDADAATEFRAQRPAYHVWPTIRNNKQQRLTAKSYLGLSCSQRRSEAQCVQLAKSWKKSKKNLLLQSSCESQLWKQ